MNYSKDTVTIENTLSNIEENDSNDASIDSADQLEEYNDIILY